MSNPDFSGLIYTSMINLNILFINGDKVGIG